MSLWLARAGKHGEHEARFLEDNRLYLTWTGLEDTDLSGAETYEDIRAIVSEAYPDQSPNRIGNWAGQIWVFTLGMKEGDWFVLPLKRKSAIAIGEVTGTYQFKTTGDHDYRHSRAIKWLATDVPRSAFDQDLLYSFGAFMTFCEVKRNDAEKRVRALGAAGWRSVARTAPVVPTVPQTAGESDSETTDLEQLARDDIAKLITQRFKGHGMGRLVGAILQAQGYTVHISPEGTDKGVDILAAPGPLGFGTPRICVQVKSGDGPVDRPTLTQLVGAMQEVKADQGLLVSWSGFKSTVERETAPQFFRVRLWDQADVIDQLLEHYDKLPPDLCTEIPLKRIWTIAAQDGAG